VHNTEWTTTSVAKHYTLPFGQDRGGQDMPTDKAFLGKTRDAESGLTLVGARWYGETQGRFLSVDPIMDLADPQQWNAYAYANNNPTTWSDPTGLVPEGCDGQCVYYGGQWGVGGGKTDPRPKAPAGNGPSPEGPTNDPEDDGVTDEPDGWCMVLLVCPGEEEPINYPRWFDAADAAADRKWREQIDGLAAFASLYWECNFDTQATEECSSYQSTIAGMPQAAVDGTIADGQEIGDAVAAGNTAEAVGLTGVFVVGMLGTRGAGKGGTAAAHATARGSALGASMKFDNVMTSYRKLPPGRNPKNKYVKTVASDAELQDVFDSWTAGGHRVTPNGEKASDAFELADGTRIQWRTSSKSGGATIEVLPTEGRERKVHISGQ
jgi:RHS repeat-associated protein